MSISAVNHRCLSVCVFGSEMYRSVPRARRRRHSGDMPSLMDLQSDSDIGTPRRDTEVLTDSLR